MTTKIEDSSEIVEYVIHAKLDPTKKYLCLVKDGFVNLDDLSNPENFEKGIAIVRVFDIHDSLKFIELPENVVGIATEKE